MPASTNPKISPDRGGPEPTQSAKAARAPAAQIERLAELVAGGEVEWPDDLPESQAAELTAAVRRCRRSRLIKLIARQIAQDIRQRVGPANVEVEND